MNRFRIRIQYGIIAAALMAFAACGGGGGGDAPAVALPFATATILQPVTGATFSAAAAINASDEAVGMSNGDPAAPSSFRAVAWTVTVTAAQPTSTVTTLAMPVGAGTYSAAYGNNNGGAIVGEVEETPGGAVRAAFWPSRTATPAQVVLLSQGTATRSAAYSINTGGRIAGELDDGTFSFAATWASSTAVPVSLPTVPGQQAASAFFVNDAGEIVGEVADTAGNHAALWRPDPTGGYTDAPVLLPRSALLSGDCTALAINSAGTIVGEIADNTGKLHAARWSRDANGIYSITDLGLADASSSAEGINDSGRAVGHIHLTIETLPVARTWAPNANTATPVDAGLLNSQAYDINEANRVVGLMGTQAFIAVPR